MRRVTARVWALVLLGQAGPGLAHPLDDPRTVLFVAVIVDAGCQMTDAVADRELPKYGFTKIETRDIVTDLLMEGQAIIDPKDSTLILKTEECAP